MDAGRVSGHHELVAREYRDRVVDWRLEVRRLEPELPRLPLAARRAVFDLVSRFLREDARARDRRDPLDDAA